MKKPLLITLAIIVAAAIAAWVAGRPLYGRPRIIDNRPAISSPTPIARVEAPNIIVTATGERWEVRGVIFQPWASDPSAGDLRRFFRDPDPLRVAVDPARPSGVAFEARIHYFCGNTFFRRPFPKHLPSYRATDFGQAMINCGLARNPADGPPPTAHP